ncbi:DUF6338 family protein [Arthrobacter sp. NPDC089319]|uniref:DUF6338 family protein n=1 Tax=Arthrobacter sp. NPDC089319 TaxID=3155915 RepID=UPI003444204A
MSGWAYAQSKDPTAKIMVSVQMKSGLWIFGQLDSFNPDANDGPDRSMVLSGQLSHRPPG